MNISEPFIRRPVATTLLMAALGVRRHRLVPVSAGGAAAAGGLPDHSGQRDLDRRQRRDHGGVGRRPARAAVRPDRRRHADDVDERARRTTIVIQFDLNRNIDSAAQDVQAAITAASKQLPQAMTTPPTYKKVNPADAPILMLSAHSDTLPLIHGRRLRRQLSRPADFAGARRRPGPRRSASSKPSIRIQVDPAKLAASGLTLEDIRGTLVDATTNAAKGTDQHRQDQLHHRGERPDHRRRQVQRRHSRLSQRRPDPGARRRPGGAGAVDRTVAAYQNNQRRRHPVRSSSSPAPTSSTPSTRSRPSCRSSPRAFRRRQGRNHPRPHHRRSAPRCADVEFTLMLTICLVVLVILLFLRNFWATLIPGVTVPLALLGSFAAMYLLRFQPRQPVADGADHRGRLRGRRRHRGGGEHLPPRRARRAAVRRRRSRARARSASPCCRSACSLIAVFIPLLLMGGIIGRLFREFALTVTASIAVSALVSLTLAPMMCSRFMQREPQTHGRVYRVIESGFDAMLVVLSAHARHRAAPPGDHARRVLRHHGADRGHGASKSRRASSRSRTPA